MNEKFFDERIHKVVKLLKKVRSITRNRVNSNMIQPMSFDYLWQLCSEGHVGLDKNIEVKYAWLRNSEENEVDF